MSFIPETDDMLEALALVVIEDLIKFGVKIQAHDTKEIPEARIRLEKYVGK